MTAPNGERPACVFGCGQTDRMFFADTTADTCCRCKGIINKKLAELGGVKPRLYIYPGETFGQTITRMTGLTLGQHRGAIGELCERLEGGTIHVLIMHLRSGGTKIDDIIGVGERNWADLDECYRPTENIAEWLVALSHGPFDDDIRFYHHETGLSSDGEELIVGMMCAECDEVKPLGPDGLCSVCRQAGDGPVATSLAKVRQTIEGPSPKDWQETLAEEASYYDGQE